MRLSKAVQAFFYRSLITFLILFTYMIQSGFSGAIPYTDVYYSVFMIFLAPLEILVYSVFYKDFGYDYLYRIYGHYKYNFSFNLNWVTSGNGASALQVSKRSATAGMLPAF